MITEQIYDDNSRKLYEKRAFSILARLRPFADIGKQRTSIRQASRGPAPLTPISDLDIVSAETRAMLRPAGQPLRWGWKEGILRARLDLSIWSLFINFYFLIKTG